jgi:uncharacterized protein with GYD domain
MIEKHSPENCPIFNEKTRKIMTECNDKFDRLAKRYGVKIIGSWTVPNEHIGFTVFEAPSLEAITKLMMEPAIMALGAFETTELKATFNAEELVKMMPKAK